MTQLPQERPEDGVSIACAPPPADEPAVLYLDPPADLNQTSLEAAWRLLGYRAPTWTAEATLVCNPANSETADALAAPCCLRHVCIAAMPRCAWALEVGERRVLSRPPE